MDKTSFHLKVAIMERDKDDNYSDCQKSVHTEYLLIIIIRLYFFMVVMHTMQNGSDRKEGER